MQPVRAGQPILQWQCGGVGVAQQAEDLANRDRTGARGREAADPEVMLVGPVIAADWRALDGLVTGQVGQAEFPGVGRMFLYLVDVLRTYLSRNNVTKTTSPILL